MAHNIRKRANLIVQRGMGGGSASSPTYGKNKNGLIVLVSLVNSCEVEGLLVGPPCCELTN